MAQLEFKGSLSGNQHPVLMQYPMNNSLQLTVGDPVILNNAGVAELGTASASIAGVAMGFVNNDGSQVSPTTGQPEATTLTVESDNLTDKLQKVVVSVDPFAIYSCVADATIGTTTTSSTTVYGVYFDLLVSGGTGAIQIDESTAQGGGGSGSGSQLYCLGIDPNNSSNLLVTIRENEFLKNS